MNFHDGSWGNISVLPNFQTSKSHPVFEIFTYFFVCDNLRVLHHSFIDFVGGALRAPPRANRALSDVGPEEVNMWGSISGFNFEHYYQSLVILTVIVKVKSCMCCCTKGKSSLLSCHQLLDWLYFSFPSFGFSSFFGHSAFLDVVFIFWSVIIIFGVVSILWEQGQMGSNGAKWGQKGQ